MVREVWRKKYFFDFFFFLRNGRKLIEMGRNVVLSRVRGVIRCKIAFLGGWEVFWGGGFEEACQCGRAERGRWCERSGEKTVLKEVAKWLEVLFRVGLGA